MKHLQLLDACRQLYSFIVLGKSNRETVIIGTGAYRIESLGQTVSGHWTIVRFHQVNVFGDSAIFISAIFDLVAMLFDTLELLTDYQCEVMIEWFNYDTKRRYIDVGMKFKDD